MNIHKFKQTILLIILTICSFGLFWFVVLKFNNATNVNNTLSSKETNIDVNKLIKFLGSKDNIEGAEYTHTKVKILITKKELVDVKEINKFKNINGVFFAKSYITLVVGNSAKDLANKIIKLAS